MKYIKQPTKLSCVATAIYNMCVAQGLPTPDLNWLRKELKEGSHGVYTSDFLAVLRQAGFNVRQYHDRHFLNYNHPNQIIFVRRKTRDPNMGHMYTVHNIKDHYAYITNDRPVTRRKARNKPLLRVSKNKMKEYIRSYFIVSL